MPRNLKRKIKTMFQLPEEWLDYKKVLIIGTGGGNDIVSATLIANILHNKNICCDVAGILSPGAKHTFDGLDEDAVNILGNRVKRFIAEKDLKEISFIDPLLFGIMQENNYVNFMYEFSLKNGVSELAKEIDKLVSKNNYDCVVGVDVGGDILGDFAKEEMLLSPIMDFFCLKLLNLIHVPTHLIQFGLGTDGELQSSRVGEIITELNDCGVIEGEFSLFDFENEIEDFKKTFNKIKGVRAGHTATMTLETLKAGEDINTEYYSSWRVGDKIWRNYFSVILKKDFHGKGYFLNPGKLGDIRTESISGYNFPIELFIKVKNLTGWKTEMDLCFINNNNLTYYLLTPTKAMNKSQREEIIKKGLCYGSDRADIIIILKEDVRFANKIRFFHHELNNLIIIAQNKCDLDTFIHLTVKPRPLGRGGCQNKTNA